MATALPQKYSGELRLSERLGLCKDMFDVNTNCTLFLKITVCLIALTSGKLLWQCRVAEVGENLSHKDDL